MGTFHDGKGAYHGITIVVDTHGPVAFIGRCDSVTDQGVFFFDADVFEAGDVSDVSAAKDAWVRRAAQVGYWKKVEGLHVPARDVASIRRLTEAAG